MKYRTSFLICSSDFHSKLAMDETSLAVVRTVTTALGFKAMPCVARLEVERLAHDTRLLLSFPAECPHRRLGCDTAVRTPSDVTACCG